ncbi:kinase-like domain-containing protein [Corynascus novoguineensis]|uniref:EKC/KEOPS complex subunit BUD32 n=1 Tax=Corynascus novoguineensis TaxID=1126955 RepID=A0AAN7CLR3_9PEZI|nr:kinase-like domain-containing protein [Corynascus novoguineensis]
MAAQPKYAPSNLDHVEDLEKYWRNGFHPVHLGDKLDKVDSKRYRYGVIHKLGYGGFSTVWLAHDLINGGYVALKIVCASQSSYGVPPAVESILDSHPTKIFVTELHRFLIQGPNGHHVCQVLPVTGPSLLALSRVPYRLRPAVCKKLAREGAQALEFLHARGLCHGDFTASNLVLAVSPTLHQLSKQDLLKLLGTPLRDTVHATGPKTASAPEYVIQPADLTRLGPSYLTDSLRVVDFDQVFGFRKPLPPGIPPNPGFRLGTPIASLAPEVIIEGAAGPASDIWALGCTLFRMRAGIQLLGEWHFNMASNVLEDIFDVILGPPPPKWTRLQFRENGWPIASPRSGKDKNITTHEYGQEPLDPDEDLKAKVYGIWDENRSRPNTPGKRLKSPSIFWKVDPNVVPHWGNVDGGFPHIHPDEAAQFLHLLRRIFVYNVTQRITAAEILKHPWLARVKR